jgi:carboxyl-terminal processing protease
LQDEIITRYYFSKGRLQNQLKEDEEVEEAIQVLNDSEKYNKLLNKK